MLGVSLDGTGYGDDGTIWGGEFFVGSVATGFERVAHLRPAALAGGDAAARYPEQAAAGFLQQLDHVPALARSPINQSARYAGAARLLGRGIRTFSTTSIGRLFDAAAALLGFVRPVTFEGQAAIWLEHRARGASDPIEPYPFPFSQNQLDFRPLLAAVLTERHRGRPVAEVARAFQAGVAAGLSEAVVTLCLKYGVRTVVASGGVFQNQLLLADLVKGLPSALSLWTNRLVPPNDGGISLGQAALASCLPAGEV